MSDREEWWPAAGSCREDCPHELAKRVRDAATERHISEIMNDPKLTADMEQFAADMETLDAGGVEADELRQKWYDRNSLANLRLLQRQLRETIEWKNRAEAAEALLASERTDTP